MAIRTRISASAHELRCIECRVSWPSWAARLMHIGGMTPRPSRRYTFVMHSRLLTAAAKTAGVEPRELPRWVAEIKAAVTELKPDV